MKTKLYSVLAFALILVLLGGLGCGDKNGIGSNETTPNITSPPQVSNIDVSSADITWQTDVAANSVVYYDTTSGHYALSEIKDTKTTTHTVQLSNLATNTTYYFVAESQNSGGKATAAEMSFTTQKTFTELYQAAWFSYENNNYQAAIDYFNEILSQRPTFADAFNGLGWCYAANAIDSLNLALANFKLATTYDPNNLPAVAGSGFVNLAKKHYTTASEDLAKVLQNNLNFVFVHNAKINASSIRLGLAEAYFFRQKYPQAQVQLDYLAPQNGLNPTQAATWMVDDVVFASYPEALLVWLEKLKSLIG